MGRERAADAVAGAVGVRAVDREAGEEDACALRDGQPLDGVLVQPVDVERVEALRPLAAGPVAHQVVGLPGVVLLVVICLLRDVQAGAVAAWDHAQSAVAGVRVGHRDPARHQRRRVRREVVEVLVERDPLAPGLGIASRLALHVHRLDDHGPRAPEQLAGDADDVRVGGDLGPPRVVGVVAEALAPTLGLVPRLVRHEGVHLGVGQQVVDDDVAVALVLGDLLVTQRRRVGDAHGFGG